MADIFVPIINKLQEIGALNFLFPYILTTAIFYGLLRKSKIFGEPEKNVAVNAVVSLVAAFMVLAYPIASGVSVEGLLPPFFMQALVVILMFMVSLMIVGMFLPPDLPAILQKELFKGNKVAAIVVVACLISLYILFLSGLGNVFLGPDTFQRMSIDWETIGVIILLILPIIFITYEKPAEKTEKKEEK